MAGGKTQPNGSAEAPIEVSSFPPVVGINFGNTYASIAVFTKEGVAECIANEDGERQIACAIAFHGEETYIGNQAKHQLIKNSQNTITGFRNLLGKQFSEISQSEHTTSAPVIQHPDQADTPAYKVEILQSAPKPLAPSALSAFNTPSASHAPTPRSEPTPSTRILTPSEVTTIFIKSLVRSAQAFLGKEVHGAVISVPSWFDEKQRNALEKASEDAGVKVLQLLDDAGAVAAASTSIEANQTGLSPDRTQLVVDLGASSLELSLLSVREGLAYSLATSSDPSVGGDKIDERLVKFFAKDFTKKTKTHLTVCPSVHSTDQRAEAKLRLAVEHTKRTISASPGAATCSVESLKDGFDYTGSINRMRFDMEMRPIYNTVVHKVKELVESAGLDLYDVDEVVYVGGSACLGGLDEALSAGFVETVVTPFSSGTIGGVGGGTGDPTTILARGCALQGTLLAQMKEEDAVLKKAFEWGNEWEAVKATCKTIGILFPEEKGVSIGVGAGGNGMGGEWVSVVKKETAVPARRVISFQVDLGKDGNGAGKVGMEIWEVEEGVRVEKMQVVRTADSSDNDDDEEAEEEAEVKEKTVEKKELLASLVLEAKEGEKDKSGKWKTKVEVQMLVLEDGGLAVSAVEIGKSGRGKLVSVHVGGHA